MLLQLAPPGRSVRVGLPQSPLLPPLWRRGPSSSMQDTKSARDLPTDPAWRDFLPRPSLNMATVVRPFAPLLAVEAAFAWLGGGAARPQVIQDGQRHADVGRMFRQRVRADVLLDAS